MNQVACPPVLFVFFNRADCVEQTFGAIRAARPRRLYLATDAPRPHVPEDAARCAAAGALVEALLDWPCEVRRDYAAINLGPDRRLSGAISWVFAHEERAIIFEEDCVPDATFFPFCAELLERYATEPRVGMISGCQFVRDGWNVREGASYTFARLTQIWGWATWRRAWQNFDHDMTAWPAARAAGLMHRTFPRRRDRAYWTEIFDAVHAGRKPVWDYRWAFARWHHNQLGIAPAQNLVRYVGFRPDALHTRGEHPAAAVPLAPIAFPLRHPTTLELDGDLDRQTARILFSTGSLSARALFRLRQLSRALTRPLRQ